MPKTLKFIIAVVLCHSAGIIGSVFTAPAIDTWYSTLTKPSFNPPAWLFGPAWLLLYTLMGIALYLIWQKGLKNKPVKTVFILFLVHLIFNALWSILFFGLKNPLLGLVDIIILLILIIILIIKFKKISPPAAWLLVPYFLWVGFATLLNFYLWQLNI